MTIEGFPKMDEQIAIQAAATAGLRSMEHLIHMLSHQNQQNQQLDCREITDFTVSSFKKVNSILNRTGHARFRRGPNFSSSSSSTFPRNQTLNPSTQITNTVSIVQSQQQPQQTQSLTLDFTKPNLLNPNPNLSVSEVSTSQFSKDSFSISPPISTTGTSSFMSTITTGDGSVSNGKLFAIPTGDGSVSNGKLFAPPAPASSAGELFGITTGNGSVSNGKLFAPFMSSITTGDGSVSNGKLFAPFMSSITTRDGSVSNGKLFAITTGDGSVSNEKLFAPPAPAIDGGELFGITTGDGSVSNGKLFAPPAPAIAAGKLFAITTGDGSVSNGKLFASPAQAIFPGNPHLSSSNREMCIHSDPGGRCQSSNKGKSKLKKTIRVPAVSSKVADIPSTDNFSWRKYGQKPIKGSPYPRSYYRCSSLKGCPAQKHVERAKDDPDMLIVTYKGEHSHLQPSSSSLPESGIVVVGN